MSDYRKDINTFTDYGVQSQDIERKRRMAELLQQQSMQPIETQPGVPISWTQGLAKLLQGYNAGRGQEDATRQQMELGKKYTADRSAALAAAMEAGQGRPASPYDATEFGGEAGMNTAIAPDRMATYRSLAGSQFPDLQTMGMAELLRKPEAYTLAPGATRYDANGKPIVTAPVVPEAPKPFSLSPGQQRFGADGKPLASIPVATDHNKPFNADGTPNRAYQDYQERLRREGKTSVSVTVPVNTEKKYGEAFAKNVADADVSLRDAAEKAPQLAERANRIKDILAKGNAITGFGADFRLGFGKAAALAGLEVAQDAAANTETLAAGLAQNTMDAIKASGMGGGTGFSNADRDFLEKAVGGKITLEPKAISRLADLAHRAASLTADRWTKRAAQIPKSAIEGTGIDTGPVRVPPLVGGVVAPFQDSEKERRYQEWKARNAR